MSHAPAGRHCLFDLTDVSAEFLDSPELLLAAACAAAMAAGATVRASYAQEFQPAGVSVLVVLAESHVSLHTYPEAGVALCDAFTCGEPSPVSIAETLASSLSARLQIRAVLARGAMSI